MKQISHNIYKVESYTNKDKFYIVNLNKRTCTCPNYIFSCKQKGTICKHLENTIHANNPTNESKFNREEIINIFRKNDTNILDINTIHEELKYTDKFFSDYLTYLHYNCDILSEKGKIILLE